jgi:hypothetical protein
MSEIQKEIEQLQEAINKKLEIIQDLEARKEISEKIGKMYELQKESQWMQDKQVLIDAISSERLNQKTAWRLFVKLQSIEGQTQKVQDWEKETIRFLRKTMKFSFNTIAVILGRSKDSVIRYAEKQGENQ